MRTVGWQARRDANECTPPPAACPALPTCQTFPVPTPVLPRPRCLPAGGMEPPQRDHPCLLRRGPAAHGVGPLPHRGGAGGRAGGHTRQAPRGGGGAGGAGAGARLPSCRALLLPTLLPRPRFSTGLLWEAPDDVAPTCLSCPSHPPPLPHPPPPHPPTPEQTPEDAEDGPPELLFIHGGHTGAPPPPPPPPRRRPRWLVWMARLCGCWGPPPPPGRPPPPPPHPLPHTASCCPAAARAVLPCTLRTGLHAHRGLPR